MDCLLLLYESINFSPITYNLTYKIIMINGLFQICLFCWNWKLFAESTVDKGKS